MTLQDGEINTGVTAVLPHCGNIFRDKVMAGCSVLYGLGKSIGLGQIQELGTIETPTPIDDQHSQHRNRVYRSH